MAYICDCFLDAQDLNLESYFWIPLQKQTGFEYGPNVCFGFPFSPPTHEFAPPEEQEAENGLVIWHCRSSGEQMTF